MAPQQIGFCVTFNDNTLSGAKHFEVHLYHRKLPVGVVELCFDWSGQNQLVNGGRTLIGLYTECQSHVVLIRLGLPVSPHRITCWFA